MELVGEILNTGGGQINVLGGYGNIQVNNNTPFDINVKRLDVSERGAGTLIIKDKAKGSRGNDSRREHGATCARSFTSSF